MEIDSRLVKLCIEAASKDSAAVDRWRLQRRSLHRLPSPLASALLHRLLQRRLLTPSFLEMFKFCIEEVDLSGENSVDVEWMAYLGAFPYLCSLNVAGCNRINNPALWPLTGMTRLTELNLSRCMKVTDAGIKHLLSISSLEKLDISQTGITADGIKLLSGLSNLSKLDLGGLPISDVALSSLQALVNLEYLDLWGSKVSDKGAAVLKNFPKLSFLNLAWTKVEVLPNLNSLECLDMSECSIRSLMKDGGDQVSLRKLILHGATFLEAAKPFLSFETKFISFLNLSNTSLSDFGLLHHFHGVEHLDLSFNSVDDDAVEQIACIGVNLRYLDLNSTKISSVGMEIIAGHVPNIEVLLLSRTYIDDTAIAYFGMMPFLKELDVSYTNIKGFTHHFSNNQDELLSLEALQDLKHFERLDLEGTQVTDTALPILSQFQALTHLSLNKTPLTDKCLEHLSSMKNLVTLDIQGTLMTNGAIDSFDPPVTLKVLDIKGCWLLTEDALTLFSKKHPRVYVKHDDLLNTAANSLVASSQKSSKILKPKPNHHKSVSSPSPVKRDVLDQRIKYNRAELLAFQHLSTPLVQPHIDPDIYVLNSANSSSSNVTSDYQQPGNVTSDNQQPG